MEAHTWGWLVFGEALWYSPLLYVLSAKCVRNKQAKFGWYRNSRLYELEWQNSLIKVFFTECRCRLTGRGTWNSTWSPCAFSEVSTLYYYETGCWLGWSGPYSLTGAGRLVNSSLKKSCVYMLHFFLLGQCTTPLFPTVGCFCWCWLPTESISTVPLAKKHKKTSITGLL